jgi:hypothetical protein
MLRRDERERWSANRGSSAQATLGRTILVEPWAYSNLTRPE